MEWNDAGGGACCPALPCVRRPERVISQSESGRRARLLVPPPSPPFPVLLSLLPLWRAVTSAAPPSLPLALLAKSVQVHGFYSRAT